MFEITDVAACDVTATFHIECFAIDTLDAVLWRQAIFHLTVIVISADVANLTVIRFIECPMSDQTLRDNAPMIGAAHGTSAGYRMARAQRFGSTNFGQ